VAVGCFALQNFCSEMETNDRFLTENDCFIYEVGLSGIPPTEADLRRNEERHLLLQNKRQEGKHLIRVYGRHSREIIEGALGIGLTVAELNVFLDNFNQNYFSDLGRSPHYNFERDVLNADALIDEIFEIASLFSNPALQDFFIQSAVKEVRSNNNSTWATNLLRFNKRFAERMESHNAKEKTPKELASETTFEGLFLENVQPVEGVKLARQMGLINEAGKWTYKTKEKQLAALWWAMKERNLVRTGLVADGRAVQIVAEKLTGKPVGKNTWNKFASKDLKAEANRLLGEQGE